MLELQSGTVDGIDNLSPDDFATVGSGQQPALLERPALNVFYVGMTDTFAPWDNVQVRQAIAKGIDRQQIMDAWSPGSGSRLRFTPAPSPMVASATSWYDFNVEEAKALLARCRVPPDGFSTRIYYRDVALLPADPSLVAQDIRAQLKGRTSTSMRRSVMGRVRFIAASSRVTSTGCTCWAGAQTTRTSASSTTTSGGPMYSLAIRIPEIYDLLEKGGQIADPAESGGDLCRCQQCHPRAGAHGCPSHTVDRALPIWPTWRCAGQPAGQRAWRR